MKHSTCCKYSLSSMEFDGLIRPKMFFKVSAICKHMPDDEIARFVLARSCLLIPLLRVRLFLAKLEVKRMIRKVYKFKTVQKV